MVIFHTVIDTGGVFSSSLSWLSLQNKSCLHFMLSYLENILFVKNRYIGVLEILD